MNKKYFLIGLFWLVVMLSAIYLRTTIYTINSTLFTVSTIDILLLMILAWATIITLKKTEKMSLLTKGIFLFILILTFITLRFYIEGYIFNFIAKNNVTIKFVIAKFLSTTVIFGITLGYYNWERFIDVQKQKLIAEIEKKQMELDFMKSRVNPHFLFNTLGSIHSLALTKSDKTPEMIEDLSDLMRYMFYDCQEDKISLIKEIDFINNYIKINQLKAQTDLNIKTKFIIENENIKIEPLIFVSFIENIFKHGDIFQSGYLEIEIIQSKSQLLFKSENSFVLDQKKINNPQSGFGLKNIKNRLNYLYGNAYHLKVETQNPFKIELLIKQED